MMLPVLMAATLPFHLPVTSADEIRSAAALAAGATGDSRPWRIRGEVVFHDAKEQFELITDGSTRFRRSISGLVPQTDGYDGATVWSMSTSGIPHSVILQDRDSARLEAWLISGAWTRPDTGLVLDVPSSENPPAPTLTLRPDGDLFQAKLSLDPSTSLPQSLSYWTSDGDETWSFSEYRKFGRRSFPTHVIHRVGEEVETLDIKSAAPVTVKDPVFREPKLDPGDTRFDSKALPNVPIKRLYGYVFVHPLVDGKDVGWFFLDTGADVMVLDPVVAKTLATRRLGASASAGAVATIKLDICKAESFELGPVTIKRPTFYELDMAPFGKALGIKIGGICGFDFFARTSVVIDPKVKEILVYRPGQAPLPDGAMWSSFDFDEQTPCLKCRFEGDREGFFNIDTGSGSTVDFTTPAVTQFGLMTGRKTSGAQTGGAGGSAESFNGKLDWFEIGGNRIEGPEVGFQITKAGVFASPYLTGNIGEGILGRFKILFDYQSKRVCFAPSR